MRVLSTGWSKHVAACVATSQNEQGVDEYVNDSDFVLTTCAGIAASSLATTVLVDPYRAQQRRSGEFPQGEDERKLCSR